MATLTDIANRALLLMGEPSITDIDGSGTVPQTLRDAWPLTRDIVLSTYHWNVVVRRERLARLLAAPEVRWTYAYQIPSGALRLIRPYDNDQMSGDFDYDVEGDQVLTDALEVWAHYVKRETNVGVYPVWLQGLMAAALARDTAFAITSSQSTRETCEAIFQNEANRAMTIDAFEQRRHRRPEGSWVSSRRH